jgi:hypothetical protein
MTYIMKFSIFYIPNSQKRQLNYPTPNETTQKTIQEDTYMVRRAILLWRRNKIKSGYGKNADNGLGIGTRRPVGNLSRSINLGRMLKN